MQLLYYSVQLMIVLLISSLASTDGFYRPTLCVSAVFAVVPCPSVTLVDCIHVAEDIVKLHSRPGSTINLVS